MTLALMLTPNYSQWLLKTFGDAGLVITDDRPGTKGEEVLESLQDLYYAMFLLPKGSRKDGLPKYFVGF